MEREIYIFDTTLREGEQAPGFAFSPEEKVCLVKRLDEIGVPYLEVGLIGLSENERITLKQIKKLKLKNSKVNVSCFLKRESIREAIELGYSTINLIVPASDKYASTILHSPLTDVLKKAQNLIKYAIKANIEVNVALVDASRSPRETLISFTQELFEVGASMIIYSDSAGIMTPYKTYAIISVLKERLCAQAKIGVHFHNDFGLATANAISAAKAGAQYIQATVNGIGERAGLSNLSEVVLGCEMLLDLRTGIATSELTKLSREVEIITGLIQRPYAPITGLSTFWCESGIPVSALYETPELYQPIPPEIVGRATEVVFGKHSGRKGVRNALREAGIELQENELERLVKELKLLGLKTAKERARGIKNIINVYREKLLRYRITKKELVELALLLRKEVAKCSINSY